jgi:hypothetical protein
LLAQTRDALERISPRSQMFFEVFASPFAKRRVALGDPTLHVWQRGLEYDRAMRPFSEPPRVDFEQISGVEELTKLPDARRQRFAKRCTNREQIQRARVLGGAHKPEVTARIEQGAPLDTSHVLEVTRGIARRPDVLPSGHDLWW